MKAVLPSCLALLIASTPPAQVADPLPTRHLLRVPPGGYVDLDTGLILTGREYDRVVADLLFDRDGLGFFVDGWGGSQSCRHDDQEPEADAWTTERQRVPTGPEHAGMTWFVRTDRGSVARVTIGVTDPYSSAAAWLEWVLAPPSQAVFVPGPDDLRLEWNREGVLVSWRGVYGEYLVEVSGEAGTTKSTTEVPRIQLQLAPSTVSRVRVRGVAPDGIVSLPSEIACLGERKAAMRGSVEMPAQWYRANAGVSVRTGELDAEHADVVFYLYGIYAPGGGLLLLGRGRDVFDGTSTLPEQGYLPSYGRLDEGDVFALRLADGRYAKFMIAATDGHDVRDGMQVHYAFLAGGGRDFMRRPAGAESRFQQGVLELIWQPVEGAVSYVVTRDGGDGEPVARKSPNARVSGLAKNRYHVFRVTAIDRHGDTSDPLVVEAHSFSERYQLGRFELTPTARQGYSVTRELAVARGRETEPNPDLEIGITRSAGGSSHLQFAVPYGGALAKGLVFGEFPDAEQQESFGMQIESDARQPGADLLVFKTVDGNLVSARIASRDHPRIVIDYVLRK